MKLQDLTIKEYLEKTASGAPVPGGGSASAFSGAIASALTSMVANLTIGKKGYAAVEGRMREIIRDMEGRIAFFTDNIDRDAVSYSLVMEAFKMPKGTDEEKAVRSEAIQNAMKHASLIPMEVAEQALDMMDTIIEAVQKGNRNAVTDGMVSIMACRGAVMGALLNVRINISGIKDRAFVSSLTEKCDRIERDATAKERSMLDWVKSNL
jgi:formiminotetrahydrofolate cyclodeaminase